MLTTSQSSEAEPLALSVADSKMDGAEMSAAAHTPDMAQPDLRKALERTTLALEAGEIGVWEWDFVSGSFIWDQRMRTLWGLPDGVVPTYEVFRNALNPADLERSDGAINAAINPARKGEYEVEYRVIGIKDGLERWILAQGRTFQSGVRLEAKSPPFQKNVDDSAARGVERQ